MNLKELQVSYAAATQDKFKQFVVELRKSRRAKEVTDLELQSFLGNAIDESIPSCRSYGMKGQLMSPEERAAIGMSSKLIACDMIILSEMRSYKELRRMALLLLEYAAYCVKTKYDLSGMALKCASYDLEESGFNWSIIENAVSVDMLIYQFCTNATFHENDPKVAVRHRAKGNLELHEGKMKISSAPAWESTSVSYSIDNERVDIATRNTREEKLKCSAKNDISELDAFCRSFLKSQEDSRKRKPLKKLRGLEVGERYPIMCEEFAEGEEGMVCRPIGTLYDKTCILKDEELMKGLRTRDLFDSFIYRGDCICGAVLVDDSDEYVFSIKEAYKAFVNEVADEDSRACKVVEARVLRIAKGATEDKDRIVWMTGRGYAALMKPGMTVKEGDMGHVYIQCLGNSNGTPFVNVIPPLSDTYTVACGFDEEEVLNGFLVQEADVPDDDEPQNTPDADTEAAGIFLPIGRILSRKLVDDSAERFKTLSAAQFIANAIGDEDGLRWTAARYEYLRQCLLLAKGGTITDRSEQLDMTEEERTVMKIIQATSQQADAAKASALLQSAPHGSIAEKIAGLMMIESLAGCFPDEISGTGEQLRLKMCTLLGVADQFGKTLRNGGGKYGLGELSNVEFKSSYVMRNDGKGADISYQGRGQVFEAVCGMLNKDGGKVYIGVNNYGDPVNAPGYGIQGDLEWFQNNADTLKLTRTGLYGHPFPIPKDIDTFCLFLNDERDLYFKQSLRSYITISPTEDQDAIVIDVKPAEFEIATLYRNASRKEGWTFVRDGQETIPMDRVQQEQRLMKLRSVGKVEQYILTLTEAIDKQHKVILKDYASSSSDTVKDRFIVPINLVCNNENIWAYDLEARKEKEFRLARIGSIEQVEDDPEYTHAFPKREADVFRWINPKESFHIKLKLTVAAYNYLTEEYTTAKSLPAEELYQISKERWILDTHLQGLGAVRRFYLGLAKEIEILDTEDADRLRQEIHDYVTHHIETDGHNE